MKKILFAMLGLMASIGMVWAQPTTIPAEPNPAPVPRKVAVVYSNYFGMGLQSGLYGAGWGGGPANGNQWNAIEEPVISGERKVLHVTGTAFSHRLTKYNDRNTSVKSKDAGYTKVHAYVYPTTATTVYVFKDGGWDADDKQSMAVMPNQWNLVEFDAPESWNSDYYCVALMNGDTNETEFYMDDFYFTNDDSYVDEAQVMGNISLPNYIFSATAGYNVNATLLDTHGDAFGGVATLSWDGNAPVGNDINGNNIVFGANSGAGIYTLLATSGETTVSRKLAFVGTAPDDPTDGEGYVLAIFSGKYGTENYDGWGTPWEWGYGSRDLLSIGGNNCLRIHNVGTYGFPYPSDADLTQYTKLHFDVYSIEGVTGFVKIEATNINNKEFTTEAGEWKHVEIDLSGLESAGGNKWIDFYFGTEKGDNDRDVLIDNVYFSQPPVADAETPVMVTASATAKDTDVTLTLKATDNISSKVTFLINDGTADYTVDGKSGEETTFVIKDMNPETAYTFTVKAKDAAGNISEPMTATVTTGAAFVLTAAPAPAKDEANVLSIYSDTYEAATAYNIGQWEQTTKVSTVSVDGNNMLKLDNFNYLGFELNTPINLKDMEYIHIDVLLMDETPVSITPIIQPGAGAAGTENEQDITGLTVKEWKSVDIPLSQFSGVNFTSALSHQLKLGKGNGTTIYVDNIYFYKEGSEEPATKTVTFVKPENWGNTINVWAWNGEENFTGGVWPGVAATDNGDGIYSWSTTGNPKYIIFNDGTNKTENLQFVAGTTYTIEGLKFTATFKNSIGWENVYAYAYTNDGAVKQLGEWPGTKLESVNDVLTISFEATVVPDYIIFNNGVEGEGGSQTGNLVFENGKEYDMVAPVEEPTSGEGSYIIPSGVNAGKELKYTWEFTQEGMDVTVTFANVSEDGIVGLVDGFVFNKTDGFQEIGGLTYKWTNCTEGQTLTAAHKWMFSEGDFVTPDVTYTVKSEQPILNTYTATFKNSIGWENVYAYAYTEGDPAKEYLGAWPGKQLQDVNGTLTISFKATEAPANIIFNNGGSGEGNQTEDLVFENGKEYDIVVPEELPEPATAPEEAADDVLAIYSETYEAALNLTDVGSENKGAISNSGWNGGYATAEEKTLAANDNAVKVTDAVCFGVQAGIADITDYDFLNVAIWSTIDFTGHIQIEGTGMTNLPISLEANKWNYVKVELSGARTGATWIQLYVGAADNKNTIFVDNIYFSKLPAGELIVGEPDTQGVVALKGELTNENKSALESLDAAVIDLTGVTVDADVTAIKTANPNVLIIVPGTVEENVATSELANKLTGNKNFLVRRTDGYYFPVSKLEIVDDGRSPVWTGFFVSTNTVGYAYSRTIPAGEYTTAYLPAASTAVEGLKVYTFKSYENSQIELEEKTDGVVPANTPVVLYNATDADLTITAEGTGDLDFRGTPATVEQGRATFTGNYKVEEAEDLFTVGAAASAAPARRAQSGSTLTVKAVEGKTVPFRAYFKGVTEGEDISTAIDGLRVSRTLNGKAYTLDGREVKGTLQKGIYIIDGKKVVIK